MTRQADDRIDLAYLTRLKARGRKFSMLTAYDYSTALAAQSAGVHCLLVGDSLGMVVLGHDNTRQVPLSMMVTLASAVRRGAPKVYLVGDMPFEAMVGGDEAVVAAALRFRDEAHCDAVKFEAEAGHAALVEKLTAAGIDTIAHLGLRPQSVLTPDGYRAQAREEKSLAELVVSAKRMVAAGAAMILLEAVPNEASAAVVEAVHVPVIGCGAGAACDAHVVVTHDMLGLGNITPPRFVPVYADVSATIQAAMRQWVEEIDSGAYPAKQHMYGMRRKPAGAPGSK